MFSVLFVARTKMNSDDQITLAIESAIAGGSISLLRGGVEIGGWIGASDVSKAEDLLFNIDILLRENGIARQDLGLIAVSAGPGSFTGIRIGFATALGLKTGLGVKMSSESALRAMVCFASIEGKITAALPVGRNAVCIQSFEVSNGLIKPFTDPEPITEEAFTGLTGVDTAARFIVHQRLYEKTPMGTPAINFGSNLAHAIGRVCRDSPGAIVEPLFISKSF